MINILHVVLSLNIGGLETFVLGLMRQRSNVTQPYVVCIEMLGSLGESVHDIPILSLDKAPGIQLKCISKIRAIADKYKIDIIHTHNEGAHFYGAVAGFLSGIPVVHTRHGRNNPNDKKRILLEWFSSLLSKKVVGVSQDIAKLYTKELRVSRSKVITISNGIDTDYFSPHQTSRQELIDMNIAPQSIVIGIVARLEPVKDHRTLFKACHILAQSHDNFRLIVIGGGPQNNELIKLAMHLGLNNIIMFAGVRHDIANLLNSLDIFVLSSVSEGLSMTLLEAMACELPIVATRVGGNPEVVIDGDTGFLVNPQNPAALAEKLLLLMKDSGLRKRMGIAGRARVIKHFSIQQTVKEYEECYGQILARNK
jgi:sugar transferase (PEP-CTERM/EpsH1 system associated)